MNIAKYDSLPTKVTLLLTSTLTVMAGATIAPSLPAMQEYFNNVENSQLLVQLVLTIPALFIAIAGLFAGQLVDKFGRKPLLIISTLLYGLAGSSGFVLNSLGTILIGRVWLGLSVAGLMTSVTTLIADYYTGQKRANFMGLQAAFMGLGGFVFLSVGGFLADISWRFPFLIYLSAWLILVAIIVIIYEPDYQTNSHTEDSAKIEQPSLPIAVLAMIYAIALWDMVVFYLIPVQLPFYLQNISNASASASGLAIATATLAGSLASLRYGFIKERLGFVSIIVLAFTIAAVGYFIIGISGSYNTVLLGLIIAGLGFGLIIPNLNVWLSSIIPDAIRGRALGGLTSSFFLGQFLSPLISQPITNSLGFGKTYSFTGGALLVIALILLVLKKQVQSFCQSCYNNNS